MGFFILFLCIGAFSMQPIPVFSSEDLLEIRESIEEQIMDFEASFKNRSLDVNDFKVMIERVNNEFYNGSGGFFDKIPFDPILPPILLKYGVGKDVLEIGSGGGALASWLVNQGYNVICIEPAENLAKQAMKKGLKVYTTTIQDFETDHQYDNIVAISSLIHVPKADLPLQIKKICRLLKPQGLLFVSFIEGNDEGLEDPTKVGRLRYFAKWNERELDSLFSRDFILLESQKIYNEKMDRTFLLNVYALK